ncbi:hypothetical protein Sru01_44110 [Sphaerisporangium rufum]|uniref:Uncharacterized protein n=1 Tax=Sphaerisporangium rufum TaxID=1381558 RepID=A0A919R4J6_9ACTN|nr:hypothetical protein Sru01_44110 [Sphaerisporangium rufum]
MPSRLAGTHTGGRVAEPPRPAPLPSPTPATAFSLSGTATGALVARSPAAVDGT